MRINIDFLPARVLLAGEPFASLENNSLTVQGTPFADAIIVEQIAQQVRASRGGTALFFPADQVLRLIVLGGEGNDVIQNRTNLPATLAGEGGSDRLVDGTAFDSLDGGDGDDTLLPISGDNILVGGNGNDVIDYGRLAGGDFSLRQEAEATSLLIRTPQSSNDVLIDPVGVTVRLTTEADNLAFFADFEMTVDTRGGDDTLFVSAQGNNFIELSLSTVLAGEGNDTIRLDEDNPISLTSAGPGNDVLIDEEGSFFRYDGGPGYDTVFYGDEGGDTFTLPAGVEEAHAPPLSFGAVLIGNELNNKLIAGFTSPVHFDGRGGDDTLIGGEGNDTLDGGTGIDKIFGGDGDDSIDGGGGNDRLRGEAGDDTINGNDGHDSLYGGEGDDRLFGGSGNDTIDGGSGRDLLDGQAGDDVLFARDNETDTIIGGTGFDRAARDKGIVLDMMEGVEGSIAKHYCPVNHRG